MYSIRGSHRTVHRATDGWRRWMRATFHSAAVFEHQYRCWTSSAHTTHCDTLLHVSRQYHTSSAHTTHCDTLLHVSRQYHTLSTIQGVANNIPRQNLCNFLETAYYFNTRFLKMIHKRCVHFVINTRWAKNGLFLEVCNSCIWWHRKAMHILNC